MGAISRSVDYLLSHWKDIFLVLSVLGNLVAFYELARHWRERREDNLKYFEDRKEKAQELTMALETSLDALGLSATGVTCASFRDAYDKWRNSPVVRKVIVRDKGMILCILGGEELYRHSLIFDVTDRAFQLNLESEARNFRKALRAFCKETLTAN